MLFLRINHLPILVAPDLKFSAGAKLGPCPNTADFCGTGENDYGSLLCEADCSGHGTCLRGTCFCHVGWVGSACAQSICWDDNQCDGALVSSLGTLLTVEKVECYAGARAHVCALI
jgi:hypothetical protein